MTENNPITMDIKIAEVLKEKLQAVSVEVEDESWRHKGHAGALEGGHFNVDVVSPLFKGKTPVERHQMVYEALSEELKSIHALSIKARTV
ncbi:MAG TPA: BolA family protein [Armatimonadota bacterium]|nr:BolA family protein [Armatimonadota bacterium]